LHVDTPRKMAWFVFQKSSLSVLHQWNNDSFLLQYFSSNIRASRISIFSLEYITLHIRYTRNSMHPLENLCGLFCFSKWKQPLRQKKKPWSIPRLEKHRVKSVGRGSKDFDWTFHKGRNKPETLFCVFYFPIFILNLRT
jgi:hypothetical protein